MLRPIPIPRELAEQYALFRSRAQARVALPTSILATIVMSGLVLIDLDIIPDVMPLALAIRLGVALPMGIGACFVVSRHRGSLAIVQSIYCVLALMAGTLACLLVGASNSPLAPVYFSANNITIVFVLLLLSMPPGRAAALSLAVIAIQTLILLMSDYHSTDLVVLLTGESLTMLGVGLYGNIILDRSQRLRFLGMMKEQERVRTLASQNALLERLSALDFLTGLSNRRVFDTVLQSVIDDIAGAPEGSVALAMIDIDHFKLFNDELGHQAGDAALQDVASALDRVARAQDLVARYGGEEFAIVMPDTPAVSLDMIGARLRAAVESAAIAHPTSPTAGQITASVGIAHAGPGISARDLIAAADRALYRAKSAGRNTVIIMDAQAAQEQRRSRQIA